MKLQLPSGQTIEKGASLAPLTSWLVGGPAEYLVQPKSIDELKEALSWAKSEGQPVTVLGGGTNVLISDEGINGLTIALRKMSGVEIAEDREQDPPRLKLKCLSGTSKSELLKNFLKYKLEPALFLAGIPGDVGGGIVMNAGVGEMIKPREFVEITDWVEVLRTDDFRIEKIPSDRLQWSYRHCEGWRPGIIVRVGLSCELKPAADILERVKQANQNRLSKQPLDLPSCGSVFVNPPGHKSGQLVEACGLKGFAIGGAKVSEKHANFIVNFNKATALDIHQVIEHVREKVRSERGVDLHTEVVYLGAWD